MKWHTEALEEGQVRLMETLGPVVSPMGFYLAGGTAVALYLGHRVSVDLDLFTSGPFDDPLLYAQELRERGVPLEVYRVERGTLHGVVEGVKISLFRYDYPLLGPLARFSETGVGVASLDDLVAMKLAAVAQRGSRKDFVDVYALGSRYRPLAGMLELYKKKYGIKDVAHVLYSLVYFGDAEKEPMPRMLWDVSWDTMKRAISQWVKEVALSES